MWIFLRLAFLIGGVLVRCYSLFKAQGGELRPLSGGRPYRFEQGTHKGRIVSTTLSIDSPRLPQFRLVKETAMDRMLKSLGLAAEVQSGNFDFDRRIYVVSDQPALHELLRTDPEVANAALALANEGFLPIWSNGKQLCARSDGDRAQAAGQASKDLLALEQRLLQVRESPLAFVRDPFFAKAVALELVVFALGGYALSGVLDLWSRTSIYFDFGDVVRAGVKVAVLGFFALVLFGAWLLSGSSRSRVLFAEYGIAIVLLVPVAGLLAASDLNRGLDVSASRVVEATVADTYTRTTRSRRGGSRTHYHLVLGGLQPYVAGPARIEVEPAIYTSARIGKPIWLTVRKGWLGVPWIENVDVRGPIAQ